MPGFNPDNINIHDLTIEEPEKQVELPFDVERDITKEDWEKSKTEIVSYLERGDLWHFALPLAEAMKTIDPSVNVQLDEPTELGIRGELEKNKLRSYFDVAKTAAQIKVLFPDIEVGLNSTDWSKMRDKLKELREKNKDSVNSTGMAISMKILDPEFDIEFTTLEKQRMKDALDSYKNHKEFTSYLAMLAHMKVVSPDALPKVGEAEWKIIKEELEKHRGNSYNFFLGAVEAKILAAEKVEVTENGLKFTMPSAKESLDSESQIMPEQRKF